MAANAWRWMASLAAATMVTAGGGLVCAQDSKAAAATANGQPSRIGVAVSYSLPAEGPLPKTYRVTLAVTEANNLEWIVSTFLAGAVRTVTAENQGKFTDTWDGLDENFMPVPPGRYGVKGIYMEARKWNVDGEFHSIVPRYAGMAECWMPALKDDTEAPHVSGDPVDSPLRDVDVAANGIGVFYFQYLENSRNNYMVDFNKPINYDQVLKSYPSGGAAGGMCSTTDGDTIWSCDCSCGPWFVHRADQKPFGHGNARFRKNVHIPEGEVTAMASWRDQAAGKSFVYLAEDRAMIHPDGLDAGGKTVTPTVSPDEFVNKIVVLDGDTAKVLAEVPVNHPRGVVARWGNRLYVLHKDGPQAAVSFFTLDNGLPKGNRQAMFTVPSNVDPFDCQVDSRGNVYLSDPNANKVYQFSPQGRKQVTYGRGDRQKPGSYDPETFMSPQKLACWKDARGADRLIVVEQGGPNRVSEWSADGNLLRQWLTPQLKANRGYAIDPRQTDRVYVPGMQGWLTRFRVDYGTGQWQIEAVWPGVAEAPFEWRCDYPKVLYHGDTRYLAFGRRYLIYRQTADERWLPSAAIIETKEGKETGYYFWRDANGDGVVRQSQYKDNPVSLPESKFHPRYWGDTYLDDFSLVFLQEGTDNIWRLPVTGFDEHGNPRYESKSWKKIITDPVLEARRLGKATALFGGNEVTDRFDSSWAEVNGSMDSAIYVDSRFGNFNGANFGVQQKLSKYVPDANGNLALRWRVGRAALRGTARPGETYGSIFVSKPIGQLVGLIDQTRMGGLLYTEDGLYVDTLFVDGQKPQPPDVGPYLQPGEFFAGQYFLNRLNDKVYMALGKITPILFEMVNWTGKGNPVHGLETVDREVTIDAAQIAVPPEVALRVRGGAGKALAAWFVAAPGGGPALDGSMAGWESSLPATFQSDEKQKVDVRCMYDPATLYLRWHVRLGSRFEPRDLAPIDRLFTHDRQADTVSFYIQGDANAKAAKGRDGRDGDVRFIFGLFRDKGAVRPVVLGLYPKWHGPGAGNALTYRTPTGQAAFEHVGLIGSARLGYVMDDDGQGFVLAAALPKESVPDLPPLIGSPSTRMNFEATLGGHNKFWWSNADGSANRETYDEPSEASLYPGSWSAGIFKSPGDSLVVRAWSVIGPWGGPEVAKLGQDDKAKVWKLLHDAQYPPDRQIDLKARYTGPETETNTGKGARSWKIVQPAGDEEFVRPEAPHGVPAGQVYYGTCWVYVPKDMAIDCTFVFPRAQNFVEYRIGRQQFNFETKGYNNDQHKTVQFKQGWNQVVYRGFCVGYELAFGLRIDCGPDGVWAMKSLPTPPALVATMPAAEVPHGVYK